MEKWLKWELLGIFFESLHSIAEDKFLHRGEDLQLRYFGQPCELTVAEIKDNVRVSDNVEDATASLSDLSLDELAAEDKLKSAVQFYKVTKETKFKISDCESERSKAENSIISLSDVGGLSAQISAIQEIVDVYLKKSQSRKVKREYLSYIWRSIFSAWNVRNTFLAAHNSLARIKDFK